MPTKEVEGEQELMKLVIPQDTNAFPFSHLRKNTQHKLFETVFKKVTNTWWNIVFHAVEMESPWRGDW